MHLKALCGLLTASQFISLAWSYGTIVEVYPSICPALPSGPAIPATQYLLTVSPGPVVVTPRAHLSTTYVSASGNTTTDCAAAAPFSINNGQLSSNGQLVSTTGLVPFSPLVVSSYIASISTTFSTMNGSYLAWNNTAFVGGHALFCVMETRVQAVYNGQLPAGCAQIYVGLVDVSSCPTFNPATTTATGTASPSPTASVVGSIRGSNAIANPFGCLVSSGNAPAVSAGLGPITVATLEQCTDYCSSYTYFGVQSGVCACGNTLASSATPATYGSCNVACTGNSAQNCGGAAAAVVYSIAGREGSTSTMTSMSAGTGAASSGQVGSTTNVGSASSGQVGSTASAGTASSGQVSSMTSVRSASSGQAGSTVSVGTASSGQVGSSTIAGSASSGQASSMTTVTTSSATSFPTSTGAPNCFDRSPFDGTVNGGYLILCNTALPGSDLLAVNGSNLAECIAACTSRSSGPAGTACVAVTFDITASSNQCMLKSNISTVTAGANDLSEAAIIVTGALAPTIVFASTASTMTSTSVPTSSTSTSMVSDSMTSTTVGASDSVSTSQTTISASSTSSTTAAASSSSSTTTAASSSSTTIAASSGPSTTIIASSSSSMASTSTSQGPVATVTNPAEPLCPTYNGQVVAVGGSFYQVQCSTGTIGETLTGNTTTAASLSECAGFCNLYNLAVPFGCVGVSLLTTSSSNNCLLKSSITGTEFREGEDSLRLIYPGYPTPTDSVQTPTSTTRSATTSMGMTSSMGTSTGTSTRSSSATGPTATGPLCPAYNGQVLLFPTYGGSNYEIQCSTRFADISLSAVIATSLTDCINQCSFLNVNTETPQCIGVTFTNTAQTNPPSNNCFPKGSITTIVRGVVSDDSARLIYAGYPSPSGMGSTMSSTTTLIMSTTPISLTSTASTSSTSTTRTTTTSLISSISTTTSTSTSTTTSTTSSSSSTPATSTSATTSTTSSSSSITSSSSSITSLSVSITSSSSSTTSLSASVTSSSPSTSSISSASSSSNSTSSTTLTSTSTSSTSTSTSESASTSSSSSSSSTTSSSPTSSTSQVAPTALAVIYPVEPVCPVNNGGQLTSEYSNLYDIACSVDLRYGPSNIEVNEVYYANTYSGCARFCDQYNLNAGASTCRGFTFVSSITDPTVTNCVLKNAGIQNPGDRTNTTETVGVNSGRLLGPWPATNQVILERPIPLISNTLYNGYSIGFDYIALTAPGGLNWQITEFEDETLYVGALGFVALSRQDLNNRDGLTSLSLSYNNNSAPYSLPTGIIPQYAVAPYWTLGFAFPDAQQGIYYQVDTISSGRFFISIEFFYTRWTTNNDIFHWMTTYDTGNPGVWTSWFFSSGSTDNQGLYETVGHQGTSSLAGVAGQVIAAMYQNGQAGTVLPGDRIVSNTLPGINTCQRTPNAFDPVAFGTPGTWSFANSPPT